MVKETSDSRLNSPQKLEHLKDGQELEQTLVYPRQVEDQGK
jgi:hypothetical protein